MDIYFSLSLAFHISSCISKTVAREGLELCTVSCCQSAREMACCNSEFWGCQYQVCLQPPVQTRPCSHLRVPQRQREKETFLNVKHSLLREIRGRASIIHTSLPTIQQTRPHLGDTRTQPLSRSKLNVEKRCTARYCQIEDIIAWSLQA